MVALEIFRGEGCIDASLVVFSTPYTPRCRETQLRKSPERWVRYLAFFTGTSMQYTMKLGGYVAEGLRLRAIRETMLRGP